MKFFSSVALLSAVFSSVEALNFPSSVKKQDPEFGEGMKKKLEEMPETKAKAKAKPTGDTAAAGATGDPNAPAKDAAAAGPLEKQADLAKDQEGQAPKEAAPRKEVGKVEAVPAPPAPAAPAPAAPKGAAAKNVGGVVMALLVAGIAAGLS